MTDLRADGAADLRAAGATGATDLRAAGGGRTDFRAPAGATDLREAGGGTTDLRELLAFARDLSLFLGMGGSRGPTNVADRLLNPEAYYTCVSFPNFDELSLQRRTPE